MIDEGSCRCLGHRNEVMTTLPDFKFGRILIPFADRKGYYVKGFFDWLFEATPRVETPAPAMPNTLPAVPSKDTRDMEVFENEAGEEYDLDNMLIAIDYVDAKDNYSQRRITTIKIKSGKAGPVLVAICHERKALRTFRFDRIEAIIDYDGEVHDPVEFFRDVVGIKIDLPEEPEPTAPAPLRGWEQAVYDYEPPSFNEDPITYMKSHIWNELTLLVAVAKADNEIHQTEVDEIMRFVIEEMAGDKSVNATTLLADRPDVQRLLAGAIRRMRPVKEKLQRVTERLAHSGSANLSRVLQTAMRVAHADGVLVPDEVALMREMREWAEQAVSE